MHFLCQWSEQAVFCYHNDAGDNALSGSMVTVIVPLNAAASGLEVWGFGTHRFEYGKAVAFPGAALHRSVLAPGDRYRGWDGSWWANEEACLAMRNCPLKLAMFFDKQAPRGVRPPGR